MVVAMAANGFEEGLALVGMVVVQMGYAGLNILSKLALNDGMNPYILISYRQLFATIAIFPLAFLFERKTRPKITLRILFQIFLCSTFGATGDQVLYYVGLRSTTPTISCALGNLLPAITFLMAVPFRLETADLRKAAGVAKVGGTIVCVGGAMLLSFYHGKRVGIGSSPVHWKLVEEAKNPHPAEAKNAIVGPFLVIASFFSLAAWFIVQARLSPIFPAPYTSSALMCLIAFLECSVAAACVNLPDVSSWSLNSEIRLTASLYSGLVGSGLAICITTWCIEKKGPLYVSVFSPLLLIIVSVLSWALLQEKLHTGTLVGSFLIVVGLYAVLWGKAKDGINIAKLSGTNGGEGNHALNGDCTKNRQQEVAESEA